MTFQIACPGCRASSTLICALMQASAYKSGEVVETLKKAFLPEDGSNTMTFNTEDEVLQYLGNKVRQRAAESVNQHSGMVARAF